jgi:hypothetical protein
MARNNTTEFIAAKGQFDYPTGGWLYEGVLLAVGGCSPCNLAESGYKSRSGGWVSQRVEMDCGGKLRRLRAEADLEDVLPPRRHEGI